MKVLFTTVDDVFRQIWLCVEEKTPEQIKAEVANKQSYAHFLMRCIRIYNGAQARSRNFGYVGVGSISFAQARLVRFQEKFVQLRGGS